MKTLSVKYIGLITLLFLVVSSCKKDDQPTDTPTPVTPGTSNTTLVFGRVTTVSGAPIVGVQVTAGTKSGTSNSDGIFAIADVASAARVFVSASKAGYFTGSQGLIPENNGVTKTEIVLIENVPNFTATSSIVNSLLLPNGSGIQLSPNSVQTAGGVLVTGNINVSIVHLDPSDPDFESKVPGGDLIGVNTASEEMQLFSYGMLMVEMTDNSGAQLELAPGSTSEIRMKVPAEQLATAPATIPLWHFDEVTGKWLEEGSAALQGDMYIGTVSHFSSWNCDHPGDRITVKGTVRDCLGNLLPGIRVKVGQRNTFTDAAGEYEAFAPAGVGFDVTVGSPELGITSSPVPVSAGSAGSVVTVPAISVACPGYLTFNLNCTSGSLFKAVVSASWGNTTVSGSTLNAGTFKIAVPANGQQATSVITNIYNGQSYSPSVTFPNTAGQEVNVGTFDLCSGSTGGTIRSSFTIDGDLFNNQSVSIDAIPLTAYATYAFNDSFTVGFTASDGYALTINFNGKETGLQVNNSGENSLFSTISYASNVWTADSSLTINVTEYGPVGGRVKGTFSGIYKRIEYNQATNEVIFHYATLTNGMFEFIRNEDTP